MSHQYSVTGGRIDSVKWDVLMVGRLFKFHRCHAHPSEEHFFWLTASHLLPHPLHCVKHYYPRQIAGINLPTPNGWIAWLARACVRTWFGQSHYTIKSKGSSGNWAQVRRTQDPLDANESTAPYITGRELNLRKLSCRQWESNPQPSRQLWPIAIKAGASTETTMVTCYYILYILVSLYQIKTLVLEVCHFWTIMKIVFL